MTPERWDYTTRYLTNVFGTDDEVLNTLMDAAIAEGIPDIAVSPDVGRLLSLLVKTTGAKRALELGTLAGYSAIFIARALAEGGKLWTVELEDKHADFAQSRFEAAGVADRVEIVRGAALDVLDRFLDKPLDFVFVDAVKTEYPAYFARVREHIAPGGLFVADNVLGAGWWIDDEGDPSREAVNVLNTRVAKDPLFDAACVPLRQGLLIARRR